MDVPVELLADDVWAAEDNKTGFLSVGVDGFDRLYLKKRPISLPMVQTSTIKLKYDKWGEGRKLSKSKYDIFWWMIQILCLVRPPYGKFEKSKNVHQFILMNVQINFFGVPLFYLRNVIFFAKILRALLSNKNEILHYLKKSIVQ